MEEITTFDGKNIWPNSKENMICETDSNNFRNYHNDNCQASQPCISFPTYTITQSRAVRIFLNHKQKNKAKAITKFYDSFYDYVYDYIQSLLISADGKLSANSNDILNFEKIKNAVIISRDNYVTRNKNICYDLTDDNCISKCISNYKREINKITKSVGKRKMHFFPPRDKNFRFKYIRISVNYLNIETNSIKGFGKVDRKIIFMNINMNDALTVKYDSHKGNYSLLYKVTFKKTIDLEPQCVTEDDALKIIANKKIIESKLVDKGLLRCDSINVTHNSICGIDPGIRTFLTVYSDEKVIEIETETEIIDKIKKIYKQIDNVNKRYSCISIYGSNKKIYDSVSDKYVHRINFDGTSLKPSDLEPAYKSNRYNKIIARKNDKIKNMVYDMHYKVSKKLCGLYRHIVIGIFDEKTLVSTPNSNISEETRRLLTTFSHTNFRRILKNQCKSME
jgi:transposase